MQGHTRTHYTKPVVKTVESNIIKHEKTNVSWRETAALNIAKHTEAGVMLKGCRYREGLTQKSLASALEIKQNHISEMENGKRPIGKVMAKRFGEFFNIDYRLFL